MEKAWKILLYLMCCSLQSTIPEEPVIQNADLESLLLVAKAHSVSAMVCMALEQTNTFRFASEHTKQEWQDAKNKAVRKNMLLDTERSCLEKEFIQNKIWYMPLKGSILKDWYPRFGMREMADNDILFDSEKRQIVRNLFVNRGYHIASYNRSNHDAYEKPPVYNFEMHTALYSEIYNRFHDKYRDVKRQLIPDTKNPYRFHFTPEDFYVFVIAHAYKHYSHGGTGIRTLTDIYIMNRKLGKTLNREYVNSELRELDIFEYEEESRTLAQKIFGKAEPLSETALTEAEHQMLSYYLKATTYGNVHNLTLHRMQKLQPDEKPITWYTKWKYLLSRILPGMQWCKEYAPTVYKYPFLLPFFWIWRLTVKGIQKRRAVKQELEAVKQAK